jgi:hypothetical protein
MVNHSDTSGKPSAPREGRTRDTMTSARAVGKMVSLVNAYSHKSCVRRGPGGPKFRLVKVFLLPI